MRETAQYREEAMRETAQYREEAMTNQPEGTGIIVRSAFSRAVRLGVAPSEIDGVPERG